MEATRLESLGLEASVLSAGVAVESATAGAAVGPATAALESSAAAAGDGETGRGRVVLKAEGNLNISGSGYAAYCIYRYVNMYMYICMYMYYRSVWCCFCFDAGRGHVLCWCVQVRLDLARRYDGDPVKP